MQSVGFFPPAVALLSLTIFQLVTRSACQPQIQENVGARVGTGENLPVNSSPEKCEFGPEDLQRSLRGAERALEFFEEKLSDPLVDAAFGTLMLESQVKLIEESHPNLPFVLLTILFGLQKRSQQLTQNIIKKFTNLPGLSDEDKKIQLHWISNSSLYESPSKMSWKSPGVIEETLGKFKYFDFKHEILNDKLSDVCAFQLYDQCNVSQDCAELLLKGPHSAYSLTHQVLYFMVANKQKCLTDQRFTSQIKSGTAHQFLDNLCLNILLEANFVEKRNFRSRFRDIFSEQVAVCSLMGYPNFLKKSWLDTILSWQSNKALGESGCFEYSKNKSEDDAVDKQEPLTTFNITNVVTAQANNANSNKPRKVRYDTVVTVGTENCSAHFTSVSLGAMAMYIRYMIDACPAFVLTDYIALEFKNK